MTHTNRIKNIKHTGVFQQKKELLIAVFVLLNLSVFAQVIEIKGIEVEIDSVLSGSSSYEITARDNITLSPGFSFTPSHGCSLLTEIDPFYTEPVDTGNITGGPGGDIGELVGDDGVVGAIPGTFAASPSGAATYTIPIECPAGVNGMTPNIALVYNSQAGNGIAGWGWNISGVSAISRMPKTIYYDDEAKEIQWDSTDVFTLDGQRLITVNDYTDSIEYRLENDPKPKIMGYDCNYECGCQSFKVLDGSGNIFYYTQRNSLKYTNSIYSHMEFCDNVIYVNDYIVDSKLINQAFYLTRQQDACNNYIEYKYDLDTITSVYDYNYEVEEILDPEGGCIQDGVIHSEWLLTKIFKHFRLKKVSYGNLEDTLYSVIFSYSDRDDSICGYISGERYVNSKILSDISVKYGGANGNELKKYSLTYDNQEYSYLQSVKLTGTEGESFNKTVFEWADNGYSLYESAFHSYETPDFHSSWTTYGYILTNRTFHSADFNGDGLSDVLAIFYYCNLGNMTYKYGWVIYQNPGNDDNVLPKIGEGEFPVEWGYYIIDTNLDGKDELYLQYPYTYNNHDYTQFRCYKFSVSTDNIVRDVSADFNIELINSDYDEVYLLPADFEGDGYPDYLLLKRSNNSYENNLNFDICNPSSFCNSDKLLLMDFNNNGKTDILFLKDNGAEIWEYSKISEQFINIRTSSLFNKNDIVLTGDFNGDGNSDILYKKNNPNEWKVLVSNGKELLINVISSPNLDVNDQKVQHYLLFDINQDGKTDILECDYVPNDPNYWKVFISNNNGFDIAINQLASNGMDDYLILSTSVGNWNFDGTLDVFIDYNSFGYSQQHVTISPGNYFNGLNKIINGVGSELNISYGNAPNMYGSSENQQTNEIFSVYTSKTFLRTVKEAEDINIKTQYLFHDPIIHTNGKGFLGFGESMKKIVVDTNEIRSALQLQKLIQKGSALKYELLPDTIINKVNGNEVSQTTMKFTTKTINGKYYIVTDSIISEDKINNSKTKQCFANYNDHLLPLSTYTRYYQDTDQLIAVDSTLTTYTNIISGDKRIIGLPESVTQYKKRPGETDFARKTDFEYYSNGMLKFKFEEKNTPKELKEEYVYDTYGNTITLKVSAPNESGAPLREQNFTYYADGYHLESKQDALDYEVSYTYYTENGLLKTITDEENDLTTELEYDGFGRQIKVTYPDGNEIYTGIRWASGHPDAPDSSLYYAYEQSSGNPPVLVFYDKFGRKLRTISTVFAGEEIYQDIKYDTKGRIDKQSQPYHPNGDTCWTTYQYDNLNRISREDYPDERFTEYDYDVRTTTTISGRGSDTRQSEQTVNGLGEVTISMDNADNTVETKYYASGLPKEKKVGGSHSTMLSYDIYGNRDTISDPDAGTMASQYNVFGELISQTDALGNKTAYTYDNLGRILTEKQYAPGDVLKNTKTYVYDTRLTGALSTVTQDSAQHSIEYYYDDNGFGRLVRTVETYDGLTIENKFTHDAYGRLVTREYPSGFKVYNSYNVNGYLKSIKGNNKTLWECLAMNPLGQITSHKQGSYTSQTGYDAYGELQSQSYANGRGMNYGFDNKGNMSYREDIHKNLKETFGYDELDRLNRIAYYVNVNHQVYLDRQIIYDESGIGNISSITGVGSEFNYGEDDAGPHALTSVSRPEPGWRLGPQELKYTAFNKVSSVIDTVEGGKTISYDIYYGLDDQRRKSVYKDSGQVIRTKHYFSDYERINENSSIKNYHYISSPTGLCAIFVIEGSGTEGQLWHTYTDHLGSLVYMVNAENSNDYKEYSFDAWGNPRDAEDWTDTLSEPLFAGSGFTGHEHLEEFALIDMNGRIYDPMLGRFFSPDPYVQLPGYAGSFNRYSYCLNNPLIYTDPNGESLIAFTIGFIVMSYLSGVSDNNGELNPFQWDAKNTDFVKMGFMGLLGGFGGCWIEGLELGTSAITFGTQVGAGIGVPTTYIGINYSKNENFSFKWTNNLGQNGTIPFSNALAGNLSNVDNPSSVQISNSFNQKMNDWKSSNRRRACAYPGYLTMIGWEYEYDNSLVARIHYLGISYNELWGGELGCGYARDITTGEKRWFLTLGGNVVTNLNASLRYNLINYSYSGNNEFTLDRLEGPMFEWSVGGGDIVFGGYNRHWYKDQYGSIVGNGLYLGIGAAAIPADVSVGINYLKFFKRRHR